MKLFIGTSGWSYKNWAGGFYPKGSSRARLAYYSKHFDSVEVNGSFYRLLDKSTVEAWLGMVPKVFMFSVKASRYITHMKRLKDCREPLDRLFASIKPFGKHCRAVLFQLPGNFKADQERLAEFIKLLPKGYRYAFEFRNTSWHQKATYNLLKEHNLAFCIFEFGDQSSPKEVTADFIYIRLHGREQAYRGNYSDKELRGWHQWLMRQKKDAYIYFDNTDVRTHAIDNALTLKSIVK